MIQYSTELYNQHNFQIAVVPKNVKLKIVIGSFCKTFMVQAFKKHFLPFLRVTSLYLKCL